MPKFATANKYCLGTPPQHPLDEAFDEQNEEIDDEESVQGQELDLVKGPTRSSD